MADDESNNKPSLRARAEKLIGTGLASVDDLTAGQMREVIHELLMQNEGLNRAKAQNARLTTLYAVLSRVNEAIVRIHDEEALYQEVCRSVAGEGGFPLVWVGRVKERQVIPVASSGPAAAYVTEIRVDVEGELGRGPTGTCIREERPVVNDDFATNPSTAPWREPALRYGFRASVAFPLRRQGRVVGALTLYAATPGAFDRDQVNLLEALSADISYALDAMHQEQLRTKAEEALRHSEEQFRAMFELAAVGMVQADPRTGRLLGVNEKYCAITGYSAGELLGRAFPDITHPEDRERDWEAFQRAARGETPDYRSEKRYVRKDGTVVWVNVNAAMLRDAAGQPVRTVAAVDDITERKQAVQALQYSLRRFELLAETASTLLKTPEPQKVVEALCRKVMEHLDCHAFFNFLADEQIGRLHLNACAGIPPEETRRIEWLDYGVAVCGSVARDGFRIVAEHIPTTPDVRTELVKSYGIKAYACHPLLGVGGRVIGTLSFGTRSRETFSADDLSLMKAVADQVAIAMIRMRDEQALRASEEGLRQANERLEEKVQERTSEVRAALLYARSLIEASLDPLVTISPEGKITDVNAATETVTGRTRNELIGTDFSDYFTEPEAARAGYAQVFREGFVRDYPLELRHQGGRITPVLYHGSVYRDEQGEIVGVFAAARDVTERKRAEEAVTRERQRLYDVMETLPAYVILLTPDYHVPFANRFFRERFGESHGERCFEYLFGRTEPCEIRETYKVLKTNAPHHWEWTGPDGRIYDIHDFPFTDTDGSPLIMEMGIDITERKLAEEGLRKAHDTLEARVEERTAELAAARNEVIREKNRLEAVMEALPVGVAVIDVRGGTIRSNDMYEKVWGSPRPATQEVSDYQAYKAWWGDTGKPLQPEEWASARAVQKGETVIGQMIEIEGFDGVRKFVMNSAAPVHDAQGKIVGSAVAIQDISDIKRAEETLQVLSQQRQLALDAARMGWWHYDPVTQVARWDDRYKKIFGVTGYESPNEERLKQLHPEDLPGVWAKVEAALDPASPQPYSAEYRINRPDGSTRWIEAHGIALFDGIGKNRRAVSLVGTVADITDRKQAEEALRESEEKYRGIVEDMPVMICRFLPDGTLTFVNREYCRYFASEEHELIGKNFFDFVPKDEHERIRNHFKSLGATAPVVAYEHKVQAPDGTIRWQRWIDRALLDQRGLAVEYQSIGSDITERKLAQAEKAELERQLQQAQKMEAVGTLAGGIAHDFNNLLQAILGYAQVLLSAKSDDDPDRSKLRTIVSAGERGAQLVRELLTFSRSMESDRRPLNLNQELLTLSKLFKGTFPKMINVELDLAENLGTVNADPAQVAQVIMNLAINARDAMPKGGTLFIGTENVTPDEEFSRVHPDAVPGDYVSLTVTDTGHGMDEGTLARVFEPFFTTKAFGKGTGLGLAIVYGIVKSHKGFITCSSHPGEGTTFKVYFPQTEGQTQHEIPGKADASLKRGTETILIVDDEEMIRDLWLEMGRNAGYRVLAAADGESALELYRKEKDRVGLIVLDLIMPGMGGIRCAEELRRINPKAKILIASGHMDGDFAKQAMSLGAKGHLGKPFDWSRTLEAVRDALDEA